MKLVQADIRNYRSLFADNDRRTFRLSLGDGVNSIAGPNNSGKSNVL